MLFESVSHNDRLDHIAVLFGVTNCGHTDMDLVSFERRHVVSSRILQALVRVVNLWSPSCESAIQSLQRQPFARMKKPGVVAGLAVEMGGAAVRPTATLAVAFPLACSCLLYLGPLSSPRRRNCYPWRRIGLDKTHRRLGN